jgi:hypothetical protein
MDTKIDNNCCLQKQFVHFNVSGLKTKIWNNSIVVKFQLFFLSLLCSHVNENLTTMPSTLLMKQLLAFFLV